MLTEKPTCTFRWWQKVLLAVGLLAGLGLLTVWFLTTATFWQQVGWRLVAGLQNKVNGEVSVETIYATLATWWHSTMWNNMVPPGWNLTQD